MMRRHKPTAIQTEDQSAAGNSLPDASNNKSPESKKDITASRGTSAATTIQKSYFLRFVGSVCANQVQMRCQSISSPARCPVLICHNETSEVRVLTILYYSSLTQFSSWHSLTSTLTPACAFRWHYVASRLEWPL